MPTLETTTPPAPVAPAPPRRGEPWAAGAVLGYATAEILDRVAVRQADPLIGPFLRGLPSLVLGIILVARNQTLDQLRPASPRYIGRRPILCLLAAGVLSTLGLFAYYFAMRAGGVVITVPVLQSYVIWGTLIAWVFLGEQLARLAVLGIGLLFAGLGLLSWGQISGQPASTHWYLAIPLALFTAVTYGVSGVLWRDAQLRGAHQSTAILLQFVASESVALFGLLVTGRGGSIVGTAGQNLAALLASGTLSGVVAIYCLFTALRLMAVARVFAFFPLNPILAALFAHFVLHEYLSLIMLAGVLLVATGLTLTQVFGPKEERQAV